MSAHEAAAVADPSELPVVRHHKTPVLREVYVGLDHVHADLHRLPEREECVFGRATRGPAMGENPWFGNEKFLAHGPLTLRLRNRTTAARP